MRLRITFSRFLSAIDFFGIVNPVFYKKEKESKSIYTRIVSLLSIFTLMFLIIY